MRKINIQQFRDNLTKEVEDLPVKIEKRDKIIFYVVRTIKKKNKKQAFETSKDRTMTSKPYNSDIKLSKPSSTMKRRARTPKICSCGGSILRLRCQKCGKSYL